MNAANPLLHERIPKLIRQIGLPVGIGVLFNNLFQVVDTFYAGALSKEALAALALSFPIYFIIIGLGSGLGTGASALIGNALGAGDRALAAQFAVQGLTLTALLSLVTAVVGIAISPHLFEILGIAGVGVATSLIQAVGSVYLGWRAARSGIFADFHARWLLPDLSRIWQIVKQGAPPALDLSTVSVGGFVVTYFVSRFGSEAVAAYGIASRLDGLIWIPLVGLDVATLVLVAQNNGARRYDRMWQAYNTALRYGFALMTISGIVVFLFAYELVGIFTDERAIIETGVVYIRISALSLWSKPLGFIGFAALRGIKKPLLPMVISMARMIVLPALTLSVLVTVLGGGLLSIWWTITGITVASGLFAWFCVRRLMPRAEARTAPPV